jgi:hypothetical protein
MEKIKTVEDLRNVLLDQVDEMRSGKGDYKKAKAISMISYNILNTYKVQLSTAALLGSSLPEETINEILSFKKVKALK